jgi:DNA polymerase-3 subunit gamma/tau
LRSLESRIDLPSAERLLGRVGLKKVEELTRFILARDVEKSLSYIMEINNDGYNLVQFARDLIHYFRKVLALAVNPAVSHIFEGELTHDELETMKTLSTLIKSESHALFLKSLIRAYSEMRYSPFAIVPLEIVLIEHLKKPQA